MSRYEEMITYIPLRQNRRSLAAHQCQFGRSRQSPNFTAGSTGEPTKKIESPRRTGSDLGLHCQLYIIAGSGYRIPLPVPKNRQCYGKRVNRFINFRYWKYTTGIADTGLRPLQFAPGLKYAILYARTALGPTCRGPYFRIELRW